MNVLFRTLQRVLIFLVSIGVFWLIVTQIFTRLDERLPVLIAIVITYIISAYFFIPQIIHALVLVLRSGRIPRVTHSADGLSADPVNILLYGTIDDLQQAFADAGWVKADRLTLRTGWKIIRSFVFNKPYPTAPFSALYLFGRRQDIGFEQGIGNSPRKRNHVRFWAVASDQEVNMTDISYWFKKHTVDFSTSHTWVGSASQDIGFGFTNLTYQISHRIDTHIDKERDVLLHALKNCGWIVQESYLEAGQIIKGYITDGKIMSAQLVAPSKTLI